MILTLYKRCRSFNLIFLTAFLLSISGAMAEKKIVGKVSDKNGALLGVSISIKGNLRSTDDLPYSIIPQPSSIVMGSGKFILSKETKVIANMPNLRATKFLKDLVRNSTHGISNKVNITGKSYNYIKLRIVNNKKYSVSGSYSIDVRDSVITMQASTDKGLFYAVQTFRQLLPASVEQITKSEKSYILTSVKIEDYPRFQWRGYMKDVSRTFYDINIIKKYLDVMALYKMNIFHFHLTDDQGWRIQLKKHPEMTSPSTTIFKSTSNQPAYRSGFYTQEDIKDIINYAKERFIEVVPEIDVPGHCWPITITHSELCTNDKKRPDSVVSFMDSYNHWGYQYTPNPLDPTKEKVYDFLNDVFTEIAELFPGRYIHFGGDEVRHDLWDKSIDIRNFMSTRNMSRVEEVQSYFVTRVSEIIISKGKIPIGWNDIMADAANLPKTTAIMSWLGGRSIKEAVSLGFFTVATPTFPYYFDISQDNINDGTMVDWNYGGGDGYNGKGNTLSSVYKYDPEIGLNDMEKSYLLGVQANMWPAVAQEVKDVNVQNFPRLLAVAETGWTELKNKSFISFHQRLKDHYPRLDHLKVDYFRKGGYIVDQWSPQKISSSFAKISVDVTHKMYDNGRVQVGFLFTHGSSFLKIKNVSLWKDGIKVDSDEHLSIADNFRGTPFKKNMFFYILQLKNYQVKSKFKIEAEVAGEVSNDSNGNITVNLTPYIPFENIEVTKF